MDQKSVTLLHNRLRANLIGRDDGTLQQRHRTLCKTYLNTSYLCMLQPYHLPGISGGEGEARTGITRLLCSLYRLLSLRSAGK